MGKNKRFEAYFAGLKLQVTEVTEPEKLSSEDNEIQKKLEVLALADRLGNVAEESRLSGVSRDTIYRHHKLIKQGGIESLKRQETPDLHHKNRTDRAIEEVVIELSLANPHLGQSKVSRLLKSERNVNIHASGVRNIWLRKNMNTTALRLAKLAEARQH